jgi:hypothetical protein
MISLLAESASALMSGMFVYLFFYRYLSVDINLSFCLAGAFGLGGSKVIDKLGMLIIKRGAGVGIEPSFDDKE